jgi:hypothetical protein
MQTLFMRDFLKTVFFSNEQIIDAGEHRKWVRLLTKKISTTSPARNGSSSATSPDQSTTTADMYEEITPVEKTGPQTPPLLYEEVDALRESEMTFVCLFLNDTSSTNNSQLLQCRVSRLY